MAKNNLTTLLAAPIEVNIEYGDKTANLKFSRITQKHREYFHRRFGKKAFENSLEKYDPDVIFPCLYSLLTDIEKEKLNVFEGLFVHTDEMGNKSSFAETNYDIFLTTVCGDIAACNNILMQASGMLPEDIKKWNDMPEDKKKVIQSEIDKLITPVSLQESQIPQGGQSAKSPT